MTVITGSHPNLLVISVAPSLDTPDHSLSMKNATQVSEKCIMKDYFTLMLNLYFLSWVFRTRVKETVFIFIVYFTHELNTLDENLSTYLPPSLKIVKLIQGISCMGGKSNF